MTDEQRIMVVRFRREGMGYTAVAKRLGLPKETVKSFCRRNGMAGRLAPGPRVPGEKPPGCRECGKPLQQTAGVKRRVFCCDACRVKWWREHPEQIKQRAVYSFTCACCGKPFTAYGNSHRKYCSHECYIKDRFKGGGADG